MPRCPVCGSSRITILVRLHSQAFCSVCGARWIQDGSQQRTIKQVQASTLMASAGIAMVMAAEGQSSIRPAGILAAHPRRLRTPPSPSSRREHAINEGYDPWAQVDPSRRRPAAAAID